MEQASVQYNDMLGTAAADWHGAGVGLHSLAKEAGIDTARYYPVGLTIDGTGLRVSEIFVVDVSKLPSNTFEAIRQHIQSHPDSVERIDCDGDVKLTSHMKRLQVVLGIRELDGLV